MPLWTEEEIARMRRPVPPAPKMPLEGWVLIIWVVVAMVAFWIIGK